MVIPMASKILNNAMFKGMCDTLVINTLNNMISNTIYTAFDAKKRIK